MPDQHARTEILLGTEQLEVFRNTHVLIAGIGGVGGIVAENLARAGIGTLTLVDHDVVCSSNLNRQIIALHSTIGNEKTSVMKQRIADINPSIIVNIVDEFISAENVESIIKKQKLDFVADCIDTIACKAELIMATQNNDIPIISSMGAGNRIDVTKVSISRMDKTSVCPLAREMRRRLRDHRAHMKFPVVYSTEVGRPPQAIETEGKHREKTTNGTISYMPALLGVMLAGELLKRLIEGQQQ